MTADQVQRLGRFVAALNDLAEKEGLYVMSRETVEVHDLRTDAKWTKVSEVRFDEAGERYEVGY